MKIRPQHRAIAASMLTWMLGSVLACGTTTFHLGPSSGSSGATVPVPFEVRSDDGVTAIQFDLLYDPTVVDLQTVSQKSNADSHQLDFEFIAEGHARVVTVSNSNSVLQDGVLSEIEIQLLQDVPIETRTLSFANIILSDVAGTQVSISWAPYVAIVSPIEGKRFSETKNVPLSAVAVDYDGTITSVEFRVGDQSISVDSTAPYAATWTATGSGEVLLTAIAISGDGGQFQSAPVGIQIAPPPYDAWFDLYFTLPEQGDPLISGITADPDEDMIPNLLEYALSLDPRVANMTGLPEVGVIRRNNQEYATIKFRSNATADDIAISVEVSGDGISWTSGDNVTELLSTVPQGEYNEITVRDLQSATSGRLIRLKVEVLPE